MTSSREHAEAIAHGRGHHSSGPSFLHNPESIDDIVDQIVGRILDQFGIYLDEVKRWDGKMSAGKTS